MPISPQLRKTFIDLVSSAIASEKAYDVPGVCRRFGLADGTQEEAFSSKFKYVSSRLRELSSAKIFEISIETQNEYPSYALGEAIAKQVEEGQSVMTELTRRRIISASEGVPLAGTLPPFEFLEKIWPIDELPAPDSRFSSMKKFLKQHYFINDDLETREVLEAFKIYVCSQRQLNRFLEVLVDPLTRETPDQYDLVNRLNQQLRADGFVLKEVGRLSGSPRFAVQLLTEGTTPADHGIGETLAAFDPADIGARWEEALKRRSTDPRAAITVARTLLEDTCKWIINAAGEEFAEKDDLPVLYRKLAKILKLAPDDHTEQIFKQILGACQLIVESLGSIRNKLGDAHSQGPKRAKPQVRHATLAVNLAGTMATFLIETWEARPK